MDASRLLARRLWPALPPLLVLVAFLQSSPVRAAAPGDQLAKVDSHLRALLAADARGVNLAGYARERDLALKPGKKVLVDIYFNGPSAGAQTLLRSRGMEIIAVNDRAPFKIVEGWLPLRAIPRVAGSPRVKLIVAVVANGVNADSRRTGG